MIVTDVIEINKSKCKVYIDSQFAFALYKGELRSYHIKKDCEIRDADYMEINEEVLPKRAKKRAMNLLKERSYTKKQLTDKLREGGYGETHIQEAISYVESYGYVDDRQYAMDFITYRADKLSKKQIEQKLLQKGIDHKIIAEAFESFFEEGNEIEEDRQIEVFLHKKQYHLLEDEKQKQKIIGALLRKGFELESIKRVIRDFYLT